MSGIFPSPIACVGNPTVKPIANGGTWNPAHAGDLALIQPLGLQLEDQPDLSTRAHRPSTTKMRRVGLEPTNACAQWILNPSPFPIWPPPRRNASNRP